MSFKEKMELTDISTPRDKVDNYILNKISKGMSLDEIDKYALEALKKDGNLSGVSRAKKYNCPLERVYRYDMFMMTVRNRIRNLKNKK